MSSHVASEWYSKYNHGPIEAQSEKWRDVGMFLCWNGGLA